MRVGPIMSKGLVAVLLLGPCVPQIDPRMFSAPPGAQVPFVATVQAEARQKSILASFERKPILPYMAGPKVMLSTAYVAALSVSLEAAPASFTRRAVRASSGSDPGEYARILLQLAMRTGATLATPPIQWPARGGLTSPFGRRWRQHHDGIDIAAREGAPIHAARDGRVVYVGWKGGYGLTVILAHGNGLQTLYGHASATVVKPGQVVKAGQVIARVGSTGIATGSHLHFEFRVNGRPVNPLRYL